jgi:hypothetical protein
MKSVLLAILLALFAVQAPAITVSGNDPGVQFITPGTGTGSMIVHFPIGGSQCSNTLLEQGGGEYFITAAHCFTGTQAQSQFLSGTVKFATGVGDVEIPIVEAFVPPQWSGNVAGGFDIAIGRLAFAPQETIRSVMRQNPLNQVSIVTFAGWGQSGTGLAGEVTGTFGNQLLGGGNTIDVICRIPGKYYCMDFDNLLNPATNVFGGFGVGGETFFGHGDSGTGVFLGAELIGVMSWLSTTNQDVDGFANGSFGEAAGITPIADYWDWINSIIPENKIPIGGVVSLLLLGAGLICVLRKNRPSGRFFY